MRKREKGQSVCVVKCEFYSLLWVDTKICRNGDKVAFFSGSAICEAQWRKSVKREREGATLINPR